MAALFGWTGHQEAINGFRGVITRFQEEYLEREQFTGGPMSYAQQLLERLEANWMGYTREHRAMTERVVQIGEDAIDLDPVFEIELVNMSVLYERWKRMIEDRIRSFAGVVNPPPPKPNEVINGQFSGEYHEYTGFRAAVKARVLDAPYPPHTKIDIIMRSARPGPG